MKKLIAIALTALALHQTNTITINYIDNTEPVYRESGSDFNSGTMVQCGTLYTSYNGNLFLADSAYNYYEVYTDAEVYPTSTTQNFNPFDISIESRMYKKAVQADANAQDFHDGLCTALTCTAGYGDQNSFLQSWNIGSFGSDTVNTGTSNRPSFLYREYKRYPITSGSAAINGNTIYMGALINNIKRTGSGWYTNMGNYAVQFDYYNPIYLKEQKNINKMNSTQFLLATQTDKGTVALTSSNMKYNSIFKTATDGTTNTNTGFANSDGTAYYKNCVVSTSYITTSTSTTSTYQYVGSYVQGSITYYVYGTKLSDSTSNDGVTTTAAQAYNAAQSSFGYIKTS